MNTAHTPRVSTAQLAALKFLARTDLAHRIDGVPAAQIKIRNARPLLRAGLIVTTATDLDGDAKCGGWCICALTAAGREVVA